MGDALVTEAERLRELVNGDPVAAGEQARAYRRTCDPSDAEALAQLGWVVGLASREIGQLDDARAELERASQWAADAGNPSLVARIKSALALTVARLGDLDGAVELLRQAEAEAEERHRPPISAQLGTVLAWRGELGEAAKRLRVSADELTTIGDHVTAARTRNDLGAVLALLGDTADAERQL